MPAKKGSPKKASEKPKAKKPKQAIASAYPEEVKSKKKAK